jgi:hypothetical protein
VGLHTEQKLFVTTDMVAMYADIGILLANNQRQHRTLHNQKGVQPYALR